MKRWVKLPDFRNTRSWKNEKARNLYIFAALAADEGGNLRTSLQALASTLKTTKSAARFALQILTADGLATYSERTLRITPVNELDKGISDPLPALRKAYKQLPKLTQRAPDEIDKLVPLFRDFSQLQHKTWPTNADVVAHFISWSGKQPRRTARQVAAAEAAEAERAERKRINQENERRNRESRENSVTYEQYLEMKKKGQINPINNP